MGKIVRILVSLATIVLSAGAVIMAPAPALATTNTLTLTFYTSGDSDGVAYRENWWVAWSDIHNGNGTNVDTNDVVTAEPAPMVGIYSAAADPTKWWRLSRAFFFFDTSALPDDAIITSATFSVYADPATTFDGLVATPNAGVYGTSSTNTAVAAADYQTANTTALSNTLITYAQWGGAAGYRDFALNAAGLSILSATGYSRFCVRNQNYDVADAAPPWVDTQRSFLQSYMAENAGTTKDPKLTITFTLPNAVSTTTNHLGGAITHAYQNRSWYSNGRIWLVYCDAQNGGGDGAGHYWTSSDDNGATWDSAHFLYSANLSVGGDIWNESDEMSVYFDGTYVHMAYTLDDGWTPSSNPVIYRRGLPAASGNITWSADWQTVTAAASGRIYYYPTITVDSNGNPWVAYVSEYGGTRSVVVTKSSNTNGTWSTAPGYPYTLWTPVSSYSSAIVSLGGTQVYVTYTVSLGIIAGRLFNGTTWGSSETIQSGEPINISTQYYFSTGGYDGNVYLVFGGFTATSNETVYFQERTGGAWTSAVAIATATATNSYVAPSLSIIDTTGDLVVYWSDRIADVVYSRIRYQGTWQDTTTVDSEPALGITWDTWGGVAWHTHLTSPQTITSGGTSGVFYQVSGGGNNANIQALTMFAPLRYADVTTTAATDISTSSITINGNIIAIVGDEVVERGFEYGWHPGIYPFTYSEVGSFGDGAFSHVLTGYNGEGFYEGETVYYRAFLINALGTFRGGEETAGTSSSPVRYPFDMTIKITQSTATAHDEDGYVADINNTGLAAIDIVLDTARDTQVAGASTIPHMATDNSTFFSLAMPAVNQYNVNYTSGNTPADMAIIPGSGGFLTTADNATLELGDNFTVLMRIYLDSGDSDNLTRKASAFSITTSSSTGNVTAAITGGTSVSSAFTTGVRDIKVSANTTDLKLYIDDVLQTTSALGGVGVPDNGNSYVWLEGVPYAEYLAIQVDGTWVLWYEPRLMISGTTLPDRLSTENATFTFGGYPAGLSVEVVSIESLTAPAVPPTTAVSWTLVDGVPTEPSGLFTEGGESMLGLKEVADAMEATGNPRELGPMGLAFFLAMIAGLAVFGATHNTRVGQKGSLFLQSITSLAVMVIFYVGGDGVIPGWSLIPFGLEALFWLITRNPQHAST